MRNFTSGEIKEEQVKQAKQFIGQSTFDEERSVSHWLIFWGGLNNRDGVLHPSLR